MMMIRFAFITFGLMGLSVAGGFALSTTHANLSASTIATRGQTTGTAPLLDGDAALRAEPARIIVPTAQTQVAPGVLTPLPSQMERVVPTEVSVSTFPKSESVVGAPAETARVVVPVASDAPFGSSAAQADTVYAPTLTPRLSRSVPALTQPDVSPAPRRSIAQNASPIPEYLIGVYR